MKKPIEGKKGTGMDLAKIQKDELSDKFEEATAIADGFGLSVDIVYTALMNIKNKGEAIVTAMLSSYATPNAEGVTTLALCRSAYKVLNILATSEFKGMEELSYLEKTILTDVALIDTVSYNTLRQLFGKEEAKGIKSFQEKSMQGYLQYFNQMFGKQYPSIPVFLSEQPWLPEKQREKQGTLESLRKYHLKDRYEEAELANSFNPEDTIKVRGVPIHKKDLYKEGLDQIKTIHKR